MGNKPTAQEILDYNIYHRPSIWAQYYTRLKGEPYRFERLLPDGKPDLSRPQLQRKFLQQPLDDQHPWKATQKARQLGLSENGVRETLWFADTHDFTKQVYLFPTDNQVKDFSRTRISEVIEDSPYLQQRMGIDPETRKRIDTTSEYVDNVKLKKIGKSYIFFRSGATSKAGEGIDCDVVTFDEIDRMAPDVQIAFNETLSASPYGWRRDISTPTLPGVGVNASFQNSDQQHWWMKCPHCGNFFTLILEYPRSVVPLTAKMREKYGLADDETHIYICVKCGEMVTNETRILGFWHPLYKDRTRVRGYQLTQMTAPWISATKMMAKREDYRLDQLFMNYVIGLPYLGDNILIRRSDVEKCIDTSLTDIGQVKLRDVCIGGDWGNESWQIVGMPYNERQWILLDLFKVTDAHKIGNQNPHITFSADLFRKWRTKLAVYDAGYGKDRNFELLSTFPGKVYSCFYPNNFTDYTKDFSDRWDDTGMRVSVDRTMTLKLMVKKFVDGEIVIPNWVAQSELFPTFIKHITNLVSIREISEDKNGVESITERIGSLPGGDHFGHAMNYLSIALRKVGNRPKSEFIF